MSWNEWYQESLLPPDVIEVHLRVGFVPAADHVQWLIEVREPTSGVLISQASRHHARMYEWGEVGPEIIERLQGVLDSVVEPF